ncbi:MAG: hypothetical protein ACI9PU_001598, partial [Ascidiaceihabitans sp.]
MRTFLALKERLDTSLGTTQDQSMDVMRTLVGIDRFKVHHMTHHLEFTADAVAAVHI